MVRTGLILTLALAALRACAADSAKPSSVDAIMQQYMLRIPEPRNISEANGPALPDKHGKYYTLTNLAGAAEQLVRLGVPAVADLLKYLDHDDFKIRFIAASALSDITGVHSHGLRVSDIQDVGSPGHAGLKAAFREWHERAEGTWAQPDRSYSYACRRAKAALNEVGNWIEQCHFAMALSDGRVGILSGMRKNRAAIFDPTQETITCAEAAKGGLPGWCAACIPLPKDRALLVAKSESRTYDFGRDVWQPTGNACPFGASHGMAWTVLPEGKVFLCGGCSDAEVSGRCAVFDPQTDTFLDCGSLVTPRQRHQATSLGGATVLITGGQGGSPREASFDSMEIFDIRQKKSRLLDARMVAARSQHAAIRLTDGTVLIAGGWNVAVRPCELQRAEVYDPATERTTPVGSMALQRVAVYAAPLPSGRIAMLGGAENSRLIEVYCPAERKFTLADQLMTEPRKWMDSRPVALKTGDLLLVGGRVGSGQEMLRGIEFVSESRSHAAPPVAAKLAAADLRAATVRPWMIEVHNLDGTVTKKTFPKYPGTGPQEFVALLDALKVQKLVIRFPAMYLYEHQGYHFDLAGAGRFPAILLGAPLSAKDE
jgi:hypothetical protein